MNSLDPRTKIVITVALSLCAMTTERIGFLAGLLIGTVIIILLTGGSFHRIKKQIVAAGGMIVFIFILQAIFGNPMLGLILCLRLGVLLLSAIIILTGQPRDYLLAMIKWKVPYELSYMVILGFHFFPILREEALDVYYSMQLRGTELKKTGIRNKLTAYRKMCLPVLMGAMERARDTAVAMEARGFRSKKRRTYLRKLKLRKRDIFLLVLIPVMTISFIWAENNIYRADETFAVIGDVQYVIRDRDYGIWGDFMEEALDRGEPVDFALFLGDMVDNPADEKDWESFLENKNRAFEDLKTYMTPGNHETSITPEEYKKRFAMPDDGPVKEEFYSVDTEYCRIISLNSCFFMEERQGVKDFESDRKRIRTWLKEQLETSQDKWQIVFMHHPMYPIDNDSGLYATLRSEWEDLFEKNGVDLVFCGHQHAYARGEQGGITYVMANSGQKPSHYISEGKEIPSYIDKLVEEPVYLTVKVMGDKRLQVDVMNSQFERVDRFNVER